MSFDGTTQPLADAYTRVDDFLQLLANCNALATAGDRHDLGGLLGDFKPDTSFADLAEGWILEIDGTLQGGRSAYFEVNVLSRLAAGTISIDLYNVTLGAVVPGSQLDVAGVITKTHAKTDVLTLTTGLNKYKARLKGTAPCGGVAAKASVVIR